MLNINKIIYIILNCFGIGVSIVASSISLLTNNHLLSYFLLTITFVLGINLVNKNNKYPLFKNKNKNC